MVAPPRRSQTDRQCKEKVQIDNFIKPKVTAFRSQILEAGPNKAAPNVGRLPHVEVSLVAYENTIALLPFN
jgi:hypothetical protein